VSGAGTAGRSSPARRPSTGFPSHAGANGARCIEINPEANEMSSLYDGAIREPAGKALPALFA